MRRLLVVMFMLAASIGFSIPVAASHHNCSDYPSQAAAQAALRANHSDPNGLDADDDGIACESLPGPYDNTPATGSSPSPSPSPPPEPHCTYFAETSHSLCGGFRQYWREFGGLAVYGFPITDEFADPTTGFVTQWFERARFEWQLGSWPERYDVLLGLLGNEVSANRHGEAPFQPSVAIPREDCFFFDPTGHNLCGGFRAYWERFGGLAVYGMPISEEFTENGLTVQYFERQRVEWHPGEWPERFDVMLGRLGVELYNAPSPPSTSSQFQPATVTSIVDGDTIDVSIDGTGYRVRLIGIDTPEVHVGVECYGPEASIFTSNRLLGQTVSLEKDVSETDRYGRLLRYVWIGSDLFNETLVRQGYAHVSTYPPDVKYVDRYTAAQNAAQADGAGLWSACVSQPAPEPEPEPDPSPEPEPEPSPNCHASYPTVCIPPPPDLNCDDIPYRNFTVVGSDPHRFDGNDDDIGCES